MEATRIALDQIASSEKFQVIYINTPWGTASSEEIVSLDVGRLAAERCVLYMWASSSKLDVAADAMREWGFEFHSVHQVMDIALHPWQRPPPKPKAKPEAKAEDKEDHAEDDTENKEDKEDKPEAEEAHETHEAPEPKVIQRKMRVAQIHPPAFFGDQNEDTARNTTEQLWVGVKGGDAFQELRAEKAVVQPYQVSFFPELGKKTRTVKKGPGLDPAWIVDRPAAIRDAVFASFKSDVKMLEMFGSHTAKTFDSVGPNIPGYYVPAHDRSFGISEALGSVLSGQKKNVLTAMVAKVHKMLAAGNAEDRRQIFDSIKDVWSLISSAMAAMNGPVSYDVADVDGVPPEWLLIVVAQVATTYAASFVSKKRSGKAAKVKAPQDPNRPRHGIASPQKISPELADFLGVPHEELMARTTAVKLINQYITEKNLQNPSKKINIIPDENLRGLLGLDEGVNISYFQICKYLAPHFIKSPKAKAEPKDGQESEAEMGEQESEVEMEDRDDQKEDKPKKKRSPEGAEKKAKKVKVDAKA